MRQKSRQHAQIWGLAKLTGERAEKYLDRSQTLEPKRYCGSSEKASMIGFCLRRISWGHSGSQELRKANRCLTHNVLLNMHVLMETDKSQLHDEMLYQRQEPGPGGFF